MQYHSGYKEVYVRSSEKPLWYFLVLACSVSKFNGKPQQTNQNRTTNDPDLSCMLFWLKYKAKSQSQLRYPLRLKEIRIEYKKKLCLYDKTCYRNY